MRHIEAFLNFRRASLYHRLKFENVNLQIPFWSLQVLWYNWYHVWHNGWAEWPNLCGHSRIIVVSVDTTSTHVLMVSFMGDTLICRPWLIPSDKFHEIFCCRNQRFFLVVLQPIIGLVATSVQRYLSSRCFKSHGNFQSPWKWNNFQRLLTTMETKRKVLFSNLFYLLLCGLIK